MTSYFDPAKRDNDNWTRLESVFEEHNYSLSDTLVNFPAHVRRRELARFISHYELFKEVIDLPGCVVELGVSYGSSFFTWAKLMETFCTNDRSRKVFGFDHFQGNQNFTSEDGKLIPGPFNKVVGGFKAPQYAIEKLNDIANDDCVVPGNKRSSLVIGDVLETIPQFLEDNPGLRISLLHIDIDLYEPTKFALEKLLPLVVTGGMVVLDEYGLIPWQGESLAVEEYLKEHGKSVVIKKHPFVPTPHGYFIKNW